MKDKGNIDPIIRSLLDACLVVSPEDRPSATQLLSFQNELEMKAYGEVISKLSASKANKAFILGSSQSLNKVYNNFIPPASLKSQKQTGYCISDERLPLHSKNSENVFKNSTSASSTPVLSYDSSPMPISSNVICFDQKDLKLQQETYCKKVEGTQSSPDLQTLFDSNLKLDYSVFNEDSASDCMWFNQGYLLDLSKMDHPDSAQDSSTQPSENDADLQSRESMGQGRSSNLDKVVSANDSLPSRAKTIRAEHKRLDVVTANGDDLLRSIDVFQQLDKYHYFESNRSIFMGEAIKHGVGILFDKDPETQQTLTYKGEFKYDLRDGVGQQIYRDGTVYNGNWLKNKPHGKGALTFIDGVRYEGDFTEGQSEGHGLSIQAVGSSLAVFRSDDITKQAARFVSNLDTFSEATTFFRDRRSSA
eukprot:CAMPEP_0168335196 /NCGR_PEP_ID=MMETSP0213-20121227/10756_1 /TAXON_ID=151035 /ORGANISM="Euplotes harpa, Strain FSP1.4" /LENGTH=418 /DNA_ID=CAMNT_0008340059 /DNA_START=982 /DNA_END=2238 /DNA_ORIENTATION=+